MTNTNTSLLGIGTLALALLAAPIATPAADEVQQIKPYPLTTCLVSGEKLGAMGEPHVIQHAGQEIKFCCKGCVKDFNKEPDKYLAKLKAAEREQKDHPGHANH